MYYTNLNYDFGIFKFLIWSTAAILIFEKASMGRTRDNSNFDSGHIQVAFMKFSAFYIFFHFHIAENLMLLGYMLTGSSERIFNPSRYTDLSTGTLTWVYHVYSTLVQVP